MLTQIHIRDLATIENLQLELTTGCTMITGETGAGKSIFIEAIDLALGGRCSPTVVRAGKEKADISLTFDVSRFARVMQLLQAHDLDEGQECIIRRMITHDGRSRCYVNGAPVNVSLVKELGDYLFHVHDQYEQQVLLKTETQREMLDRYGDLTALASEIKQLAENWKAISLEKNELILKHHERHYRRDYLQFQLDELINLQLQPGEWENLEKEHRRCAHAETLLNQVEHSIAQLNDEQGLLKLTHDMRRVLENMSGLEPQAKTWLDNLQAAIIQLSDLASDLQHYLDNITVDPEKTKVLEERVSMIFNLSRKHKIEPAQLAHFMQQLQQELASLNACDANLAKLNEKQAAIEADYVVKAKKLSEERRKASKKLEKIITTTIRSLSLPHGDFSIRFEELADTTPALHGQEKPIFLIKTNPDQSPQPLAKVISGGELSRLSLSLHLALAHRTNIPTLIFDEVDTGLSGATAEKIGRLLHKLGQSYQVFCVTHQAQVAALGHQHLLVKKHFIDSKTHTQWQLLTAEERIHEIARMLGGETITTKTREHAREMLAIS